MLYKNDEQYKLTPIDIGVVKKKFRKFPIRLTYPPHRVRTSSSKHNTLPDKPNSIAFPLSATAKTPTGADVWRYAENRIVGRNGDILYTPHSFTLTGTFVLHEQDMELIWWLYTKCPYLEGGMNYNGRPAKCVFEDLIGQAEIKAQQEEKFATVKAYIYSSKVGLKEDELRRLAKAYFIPGVDDLTFAQVKLAVEVEVGRDRLSGVEKFLGLAESAGANLNIRAMLQEAIDKKLIKYTGSAKREWVWLNSEGRKEGVIAQVVIGTDPYEALFNYYKGDRNFQQNLQSSLKGDKVVLTEGAGDVDDYESVE